MASKKSYGKKPAETMRQRQQRLLREQRARKAAASKPVKTNPASSTSRGAQGPRTAPQQGPSQRTVGLQGTRSRGSVRRSAPKPEFSTKSAPKQKALPPGKKGGALATTNRPPKQKALPPGKKGGALATTNRPRRRNVKTNPPKGTQMGTKGGGVKGQPRLPQATIRSAGAASKALSTTGKAAGRIVLPLSAYLELKDLKDSLDRGEGYARLPGIISKVVKGNNRKKTTGAKSNKRGRRVGAVPASKATPTKSAKSSQKTKPLTDNQKLARSNKTMDRTTKPTSTSKPTPTKKPAASKSTPARKPTPKAATGADARSLRSGPTPPKPAKATKPAKKVYGSTGRKDLKQSARMAAALKDLKIRRYKNKE